MVGNQRELLLRVSITSAIESVDSVLSFLEEPVCCSSHSLRFDRLDRAVADANELLSFIGDVRKVQPSEDLAYRRLVARVSSEVRRAGFRVSRSRLERAMRRLRGIRWEALSPGEASFAIERASRMLPNAQAVWRSVFPIFARRSRTMVASARRSMVRGMSLDIGFSLDQTDEAIAEFISSSQQLFVTDRIDGFNAAWSERARRIVAEGQTRGLGRAQIAADLERYIGPASMLRRQANYWEVISGAFLNRARNFTHLNTFQRAGIRTYRFDAVMDERTTEQCSFFHGKEWSVGEALDRFRSVAEDSDPRSIKDRMPWVRTRRGEDGRQRLFVRRDDRDIEIATVVRPSVGLSDTRGVYETRMSDAALERLGVVTPPLHAGCRSTIIAG